MTPYFNGSYVLKKVMNDISQHQKSRKPQAISAAVL